jgi:hypothetical protein
LVRDVHERSEKGAAGGAEPVQFHGGLHAGTSSVRNR